MIESTTRDYGDRTVVTTGDHETSFRQTGHPGGESTAKCAATQIASLQQRIVEQDAILSKLPTCWRLFGEGINIDDPDGERLPGKLVQDCSVVPGMKIYKAGEDKAWKVTAVRDGGGVDIWAPGNHGGHWSRAAGTCANSPKAAAELAERTDDG